MSEYKNRKGKCPLIFSSSPSEEGMDDGDEEEDEDEDKRSVSSWSDSGADWSEEEEEEDSDDGDDDDESLCGRVVRVLQEGSDLEALSLSECKAYLRKHSLRISGIKAECVQRIQEHWRIKDGNGEALYPRSSFSTNCTGDVCKGDIVIFTQKVYERFDKVTRSGRLLGKRTIAGKVVKETYGAAKQQHTFTVEVLWSKGIKKLPPMFPLLVKGRNLYKFRTFRQLWTNEAARVEVLAEKHKRGTAARLVRATNKTKKTWSATGGIGAKRHKHLNQTCLPSQMKQTIEPVKVKRVNRRGKAASQGQAKLSSCRQKVHSTRQVNLMRDTRSDVSGSSWKHQKPGPPNDIRVPAFQSLANPPQNAYQFHYQFQHRSAPNLLTSFNEASASAMMRLPPFRPYTDLSKMPVSRHQVFNNKNNYTRPAYRNTAYHFGSRNLNSPPEMTNYGNLQHPFPPRINSYEQRNQF